MEEKMVESYRTVYRGGTGELVEKKSRFIATVRLVETEDAALKFIEEMRKKYWDATHNCFAYVIGMRGETMRAGDDGEPSGTAGRPMLDVLLGEGLVNTAVVVTRYFGGTLLGTGGLVRAYSGAVQEGLKQSELIQKIYGSLLEVHTDYTGLGKLQYLLGQQKIPVLRTDYTDQVALQVILPAAREKAFAADVTEATSGKAEIRKLDSLYYAEHQGRILIGEE
jgi:uncharacterized YigZ family protein